MCNYELALFELRSRAEETMRRAARHSRFGPAPKAPAMRLFGRHMVRLPDAIEIRHPANRGGQAAIDRRLRELARR